MENTGVFFDAIQEGNLAAARKLLAEDPSLLAARSAQGLSPVLAAAYYHEPGMAAWLVEQGASLDMFEACAVGAVEKVKCHLDENPELLNVYAPDGFQPLGLAAFFGQTALVRLLLEHGAEAGSASRNGMKVTPLHSAAAGSHLEIVRQLVEVGAPVNARAAQGFTALHSAAQNGQVEMVRLLLEHGADPQLAADTGKKPADLAKEGNHQEVVELLLAA